MKYSILVLSKEVSMNCSLGLLGTDETKNNEVKLVALEECFMN